MKTGNRISHIFLTIFAIVLLSVCCFGFDKNTSRKSVSSNIETDTNKIEMKQIIKKGQFLRVKRTQKYFFKGMQLHLAKKNQTITCPELNNFTFTNEPPYDVLGIPECGPQVQPQMMLYFVPRNQTRENLSVNANDLDSKSNVTESEADSSKNTENTFEKENSENSLKKSNRSETTSSDEKSKTLERHFEEDKHPNVIEIVLKDNNSTKHFGKDQKSETSLKTKYDIVDKVQEPQNNLRVEEDIETNELKIVHNTDSDSLNRSAESMTDGDTNQDSNSEFDIEDTPLQCDLIPAYLPNNVTDSCFAVLNARTDIDKVVILVHGYLNSFPTVWMHNMQASIQALEPNAAIIIYGWGHGLGDIWTYWRAARNSRYAGRALFEIIKLLQEKVERQLYIHCVGHSLGAHVCGFAGKHIIELNDPKIRKFNRISGMDPAGPMFFNDVPFPFNGLNVDPSARLGQNDADYVDAIHTDGNARYLDYIPQYGTLESVGTVDFYPGRDNKYYGCYQPGCGDVFDVVSCSHSRAHEYYAATIDSVMCLASRKCDGDPHDIPNGCVFMNTTTDHNHVAMGYWLDPKNLPVGRYTVEVVGSAPFCG